MKDLKQQIQELKERLATLEGMVDRVSEQQITRDYGKFVPEQGDEYFYIDNFNEHLRSVVTCQTDENRTKVHNTFSTRKAAEAEAKYTLISRQYRNFARKLNLGKVDWNDVNQLKWGIQIDVKELEVCHSCTYNGFILQIAFHEKAHAELALEVFGNDLLILANN